MLQWGNERKVEMKVKRRERHTWAGGMGHGIADGEAGVGWERSLLLLGELSPAVEAVPRTPRTACRGLGSAAVRHQDADGRPLPLHDLHHDGAQGAAPTAAQNASTRLCVRDLPRLLQHLVDQVHLGTLWSPYHQITIVSLRRLPPEPYYTPIINMCRWQAYSTRFYIYQIW